MTLPIELRLLSSVEAAELGTLLADAPEGTLELACVPQHLWSAAVRLALWQMPASATRH